MSLSEICAQRHQHEQKQLKRVLLWGLLGSLGGHGVALSLSQFKPWQGVTDDVLPIELIATDGLTDPMPEALSDSIQAGPQPKPPAAPPTASSSGGRVPPPASMRPLVRPVASDSPKPGEPPQSASALDASQANAEEDRLPSPAVAVEERPEGSVLATGGAEPSASQSEGLGDQLGQPSPRADPGSRAAQGTLPNGSAGNSPMGATAPANAQGNGNSQGSRAVTCQTCVRPSYPQSALDARIEGQPMVRVDINPDGTVRRVTLTRSSGHGAIDRAAIEAARNSRFQPIAGGATVPIEYDLTIEGSRRNRDARRRGERQAVDLPPWPPPVAPSQTNPRPALESIPAPGDPPPAPAAPSPISPPDPAWPGSLSPASPAPPADAPAAESEE